MCIHSQEQYFFEGITKRRTGLENGMENGTENGLLEDLKII